MGTERTVGRRSRKARPARVTIEQQEAIVGERARRSGRAPGVVRTVVHAYANGWQGFPVQEQDQSRQVNNKIWIVC